MVSDKFGSFLAGWQKPAALGSAIGFAVFTLALRHGKSTEMLPTVFLSGLLAIPLTGLDLHLDRFLGFSLPERHCHRFLGHGCFPGRSGFGALHHRIKDNPGCRTDAYIPIRGDAGTDGMDIPERDSGQIDLARGAIILSALAGTAVAKINRGQVPVFLIRVTIQHHNTCKPPWPMHGSVSRCQRRPG